MSNFTTPSSSDFGGNLEVTYFKHGRPVRVTQHEVGDDGAVTVAIIININDSDTDVAENPSEVLYTRSSDSHVDCNSNQAKQSDDGHPCNANTNVAPEDKDLGYTDNGVPIALLNEQIGQTGLTYGDLDRVISAIADDELRTIWDLFNVIFVPTVQSVGARQDRDGLWKIAGRWDYVQQCFDMSNAELVRDYIDRHER